MGRTVLSLLAGYGAIAVLTVVLFVTLAAVDPEAFSADAKAVPGVGGLVATLFGGLIAAVAGGFVTAWIARRAKLSHVLGLAGLVLALGVTSLFVSEYPAGTPVWYLAGLPVVGLVGVLLGGRVRIAREAAAQPA